VTHTETVLEQRDEYQPEKLNSLTNDALIREAGIFRRAASWRAAVDRLQRDWPIGLWAH
jgi:hypothetical protein